MVVFYSLLNNLNLLLLMIDSVIHLTYQWCVQRILNKFGPYILIKSTESDKYLS